MALPLPLSPPARPKAAIRTPLFLLGVGMALLAFVGMFAFGIVFANRGLTGGAVPVVVAAADIQARQPINIAMLSVVQVSASSLQPHAFTRLQDVTGYSPWCRYTKARQSRPTSLPPILTRSKA